MQIESCKSKNLKCNIKINQLNKPKSTKMENKSQQNQYTWPNPRISSPQWSRQAVDNEQRGAADP